MKYQLIKPINKSYSPVEQILTNRGIKLEDIPHYLNTTEEDINSYNLFGEEKLKSAAAALITVIGANQNAIILVDSDCDGFTSSALLFNYLYRAFPQWTEYHLSYLLHNGKQHGLNDQIDSLLQHTDEFNLAIIPDAGTNDTSECERLYELNIPVIILDHHEADIYNPYGIIINNQCSDYPNKFLSGVGVVWQFCRYLDNLLSESFANEFLDLVAVGNIADMMSLQELETKHLIQLGLASENLKNPFLVYMADKNNYKLTDKITPTGVAFYIAPFVNAIVRSGTMEEKALVFKSMLQSKAFKLVPSTKRGHKQGEMEKIVEQAIRVATNVKSRQTKVQDSCLDLIESKIQSENLLQHKVILILLEPGQVDRNVAGLVANKIMAEYQRPCCILTRVEDRDESIPPWEDTKLDTTIVSYQGSARGCDKVGVTEFKDICAATGQIMYATGHQGAFGLGIKAENIQAFLEKTDEILKDMPDEAVYHVDYIWDENNINSDAILEIANLESLWGKDLDEPFILLKNVKVSPDMVAIYKKSTTTINITLPNNISLVLFLAKDLDCDKLQYNNTGYIEVNFIVTCDKNEWMGRISPQFKIKDYEIVDSKKYFF